ncbi:MAG: hypothetical protein OXI69_16820 [Acidobacteriota bacterium]|nr:hypothetical protein [Acidobacteriota bacterium]
MTRRKRPLISRRRAKRSTWQPVLPRIQAALEVLLHPRVTGRTWKYLPLVLALAFAARAAVALSGDFVLHPDEIMQYLEPAHRLVFGSGITYWEYFYGARSWLVPGTVAGLLMLFDAVGLGQPFWYVGGVKLLFCAISLAIPAGMYVFARRHFGETAGRAALLAGAFWYELVGFAHKPMTEFVAAAPLMALLALCVRPSVEDARTVWTAAFLACITAAIRLQYAPIALLLLGIVFLRTGKRMQLILAGAGFTAAFGLLDAVTWDGGLFHSYVTNIRYNLILGSMRTGESPAYQYLIWLTLSGLGLSVLCVAAAFRHLRRYGFLLGLIALVLLVHSLQAHKEYRFIFAVIPLWLLTGADLTAGLAVDGNKLRRLAGLAAAGFAALSLAGILNALPYQGRVYKAWSRETGVVGFVRNRDPIFPAYRFLARAPGVSGVWQVDRPYINLPGYYYLHHKIPFYDLDTGRGLEGNVQVVSSLVSHIVSADSRFSVPGYSLEREFGEVRILRRDQNEPPVRPWIDHAPVLLTKRSLRIMRQMDPDGPSQPANFGIRFADPERP